jgi:hypothetical protein
MTQSGRKRIAIQAASAVMLAGATFGFASCGSSARGVLLTLNPCGTVFDWCEPTDLQVLLSDVPEWGLDPTCSVPYYGVNGVGPEGTCGTSPTYQFTPGPRAQPVP